MNVSKEQLLNIIEKVGPANEIKAYINVYHQIPRHKFGTIHIDSSTLVTQTETIAEDIAIMNQLDIYPIIVAEALAGELEERINQRGGSAKYLDPVFKIKNRFCNEPKEYEFNIKKIKKTLASNYSPIICNRTTSRTPLSQKSRLAEKLVVELKQKKLIILTEQGYLLDYRNRPISFINLSDKQMIANIEEKERARINHFAELLAELPGLALILTSANQLLQEIFTVKGSGTFFKSHRIKTTTRKDKVDWNKIKTLMEDAFSKELKADYLEEKITQIFYQKDYEGIAIISNVGTIPYLDKFAVGKLFQGTGLGKSIWLKILRKYPRLMWRAAAENPLNSFYLRECTGCHKYDRWHIYWKNIPLEEALTTVNLINNKKASFHPA